MEERGKFRCGVIERGSSSGVNVRRREEGERGERGEGR
jgi:hypothetical protein